MGCACSSNSLPKDIYNLKQRPNLPCFNPIVVIVLQDTPTYANAWQNLDIKKNYKQHQFAALIHFRDHYHFSYNYNEECKRYEKKITVAELENIYNHYMTNSKTRDEIIFAEDAFIDYIAVVGTDNEFDIR